MPNALANTRAALEAQAAATARIAIEMRARRFAADPELLDMIEPGLSKLRPRQLRNRIGVLIGEQLGTPRRWHGFGGEIPLINLRAAASYSGELIERENEAKERNALGAL